MKIVEKVGTHKNIVIMVWHFSYHTLYQPEVILAKITKHFGTNWLFPLEVYDKHIIACHFSYHTLY
jgi:hypothetical protein